MILFATSTAGCAVYGAELLPHDEQPLVTSDADIGASLPDGVAPETADGGDLPADPDDAAPAPGRDSASPSDGKTPSDAGAPSDGKTPSEAGTSPREDGAPGRDSASPHFDAPVTPEPPEAGSPDVRDGSTMEASATACSMSGGRSVRLTIENSHASRSLLAIWVDGSCAERVQSTIAPLTTFRSSTFTGHVWRFRDSATQAIVRDVPALTGDTTVSIP